MISRWTDFYVRDRAKGTRLSCCKACKSEYNRLWYERNRDEHMADVMKDNARYRAELESVIAEAKDSPCMDCGQTFHPEVMDFDHVRGQKSDNVSRMVRRMVSLTVLQAELEKCELVYANCDRVRTARRRER